jgi:DNA-binding FadR family transcriptional regulator
MALLAPKPRPLGEHVYQELLGLILAGEYAQDSRLPGELDLAQRFGVSRPVLRQALSRLRAEGLIYTRHGAGNFVQRRSRPTPLDYGPLQSVPDVQRCLEFRCGLESAIAGRAASLHDSDSLQAIRRAMQQMEQAEAAGEHGLETDFAFHLEIARATRNRFFVTTLEALRPQVLFSINLIRSLSTRPLRERLHEVHGEHRQIVEAIAAGDSQRAERAMSDHLQAGIKRLFGD